MKTVINVGIGGRSFTINEDAYLRLDMYLTAFKEKAGIGNISEEVMSDVEYRIADILSEELASVRKEVVDIMMVDKAISMVGMPDGSSDFGFDNGFGTSGKAPKKFFRDPDDRKIAGVCSGLAAYLDVDVTLIRIIFLVALICGTAGFWIYIIFWIVAPLADTAVQKCQMRGIPANAGNIRKYSCHRK